MEKNLHVKGIAFGIICLLLFAVMPMLTAVSTKKISTSNGPYFVYIKGICYSADAHPFFVLSGYGFQIGPFCRYVWPYGPDVDMENGSVFYVNGVKQNVRFPADIGLFGFFGFAPTLGIWFTKAVINGYISQIFRGKGYLNIRIFGMCREYEVCYHSIGDSQLNKHQQR